MTITSAQILPWMALLPLLAAVAWTDGRSQRIPNSLNAILFAVGLATSWLPQGPGLAGAVAGAALGGCLLLAVALAFRHYYGKDGLGLGDVKFLAAAGTWVGWQGVGSLVFVAATTALLWISLRRLLGAAIDSRARIAFGPFLCFGLLVTRMLLFAEMWPSHGG